MPVDAAGGMPRHAAWALRWGKDRVNFRSIAQLSDQLLTWSKALPKDIELVVGVPRSGLIAATMLAAYRNLPVTDVDGLIARRVFSSGLRGAHTPELLSTPRRVLVLDDSVNTGESMRQVKERISGANLQHHVRYAAVYVQPHRTHVVDFYCEVLNQPRVFEWNVLHRSSLSTFCLDLDGVLCFDPDARQNDDGEEYLRFLDTAEPLLKPTRKVGWVVTSRLEKYREATERWLDRNGIEYGELIMMDYPDAATRRALIARSAFKAEAYRRTGAALFLESSLQQSFEIANLAGRDVLCIGTMQLVRPGLSPLLRPVFRADDVHPPSLVRRAARRLIPERVRARLLGLVG